MSHCKPWVETHGYCRLVAPRRCVRLLGETEPNEIEFDERYAWG